MCVSRDPTLLLLLSHGICGRDSCVVALIGAGFNLAHASVGDLLILSYALLVVERSVDKLVEVACGQALAFKNNEPMSAVRWREPVPRIASPAP